MARLGYDVAETSHYGPEVVEAVRQFQRDRGLRPDGVVDRFTWDQLIEAGYRLGDRLLYLRSPHTRGDDVAELQARLSSLGFHSGRVDGIFGERTAEAVAEFQRNVGLPDDGRVGPQTLEELGRLDARSDLLAAVASLKEEEALRSAPHHLSGLRIGLGHGGDAGPFLDPLRRLLTRRNAAVVPLAHPEESRLAAIANAAEVHVLLVLRPDPHLTGARLAYYASYRWESPGGRSLAERAADELNDPLKPAAVTAAGMAIPLLRETRMPTVLCELGPIPEMLRRTPAIAEALSRALQEWLAQSGPTEA
jgi:N-acetylmuramoyl-L-alanine amidase